MTLIHGIGCATPKLKESGRHHINEKAVSTLPAIRARQLLHEMEAAAGALKVDVILRRDEGVGDALGRFFGLFFGLIPGAESRSYAGVCHVQP